ncbi:MAG: flavin reductase family protein [Elusimicrobiales bacterium]|nr:flavin reductase family protein [Elusimicrobiales bacterium]
MKRSFPLSKVYSLLESGPVVMVSTALKGRNNIMTMSWHTMIDFNPPLVGCVISDRNYTFGIVKKTRECVINIPTLEIAKKAVACGNVSGARADKFKEFGLTPEKASTVKAPLIKECYASLECELADARMAGKYNLFVFKVRKAWVDTSKKNPRTIHHRGGEDFIVAGKPVKLKSRMA